MSVSLLLFVAAASLLVHILMMALRLGKAAANKDTTAVCTRQSAALRLDSAVFQCHQLLGHLSAQELCTSVAPVSRALRLAAGRPGIWKALWRARFEKVRWALPEPLRCIAMHSDPLCVLLDQLKKLKLAPCWWSKQPRAPYEEELLRWQGTYREKNEDWKLFYLLFAQHWCKWVVAPHNTAEDCWLVIHSTVFDVTNFDGE